MLFVRLAQAATGGRSNVGDRIDLPIGITIIFLILASTAVVNLFTKKVATVWGIVKRYARIVGVPATTHHFRHAKASVLLNRGATLSEVQDILGHASPETTKRIYAHYQTQHLREAFDRYSASAEDLVAELPARHAPKPAPANNGASGVGVE